VRLSLFEVWLKKESHYPHKTVGMVCPECEVKICADVIATGFRGFGLLNYHPPYITKEDVLRAQEAVEFEMVRHFKNKHGDSS